MAGGFRFFPEVQQQVSRLAGTGLGKRAIHQALKDQFGRSYRDIDLMADLRRFRQKPEPTPEVRLKAIPKKFRGKQEQLLIQLKSPLPVSPLDIKLNATSPGNRAATIKTIKEGLSRPVTKNYAEVSFSIGDAAEQEELIRIYREEGEVLDQIAIPLSQEKKILNVLANLAQEQGGRLENFRTQLLATGRLTRNTRYHKFLKMLEKELPE